MSNAVQPVSQKIIIPEARLAFADRIFEAKPFQGEGKATYGCTLLLPENAPILATIIAEENRVAKEKWGAKADASMLVIRANNRQALKPGALKANFDGFPGNFFISCTGDKRPTVVNRDKTPLTAADGVIYSGCYVLAHVSLWAQDNNWGQRINAELTGLQFLRDGDAFSGGAAPSAVDDFADLGAGEDAADLMS